MFGVFIEAAETQMSKQKNETVSTYHVQLFVLKEIRFWHVCTFIYVSVFKILLSFSL